MTIENTILEGVYVINNFNAFDKRGLFVKTFNSNLFNKNCLDFKIRESYYSVSKENVIRGMHFQLPPHDHEKLVYVSKGAIIDVVVDLRRKSKTYKKYISVELSEENKKSIYISKGFAHGFKSIKEDTITIYNVTSEYNPEADHGINFDSFGFDWEVSKPILSERDNNFYTMNEFDNLNPF
ncbi:dTDP-4-dehydrorhamnose 3,5-epimerase family protein [Polaribacter sp.]|nr:dTDP-4-dehydrorhamnose 3,5-epimerase family protein [Polaribacter sp.]